MIRVGIVGATGYGARELQRLLIAHPEAEVTAVVSESGAGQRLDELLPAFRGLIDLECQAFDAGYLADHCDVVCIAVPGTKSMAFSMVLRKAGVRVLDLGPDFRLKDPALFAKYYKTEHIAPELLEEAVYGMVFQNRDAIRNAGLVAVPGCYPLSAIAPLAPLLEHAAPAAPVVVDAISGISGAGRSLNDAFHFPEMNENLKAYKLAVHQHTPEIEQALSNRALVQFTPHVAPLTRGILTTITARFESLSALDSVYACHEREPFIRVLGEGVLPEVKYVRATNFCDFGWVRDERTGNLLIVSAIDNMHGGTAGMAVQCMNLMFGLDERTGLITAGMAP